MNCAYHSDREPIGACISCGRLVCIECKTLVGGKIYCNPCAEQIFVQHKVEMPPAIAKTYRESPQPKINYHEPISQRRTPAAEGITDTELKNIVQTIKAEESTQARESSKMVPKKELPGKKKSRIGIIFGIIALIIVIILILIIVIVLRNFDITFG